MALWSAQQLSVSFERVSVIDVVPGPSLNGIDFNNRTFLNVTLSDGSIHPVVVSCGGIAGAFDPPCMSQPTVPLSYPRGPDGGGGYTDTPEGSTPFPELDAATVKQARPLHIANLVIPIAGVGPQTIIVGRALLPNGYLAEGDFALTDPWPSNILFTHGIQLDLRPVAGGLPFRNLYEHGWHEGVEEVEASLTFDIAWFEPGASCTVVDLVVR